MSNFKSIAMTAFILSCFVSPQAFAQGAVQTISLMQVNPTSLATGYRASKVVGSTVLNEAGETVGSINDLIITPSDKVPYAVISVGGFLGMGTKYVVVAANTLEVKDNKMLLRGATKEALKALPSYTYTN